MRVFRHILTLFTWTLATLAAGQSTLLEPGQYDQLKTQGLLPEGAMPITASADDVGPQTPIQAGGNRGGGDNDCACWIQPDATYTLAMAPNDDGSSAAINLPFAFNLYGDSYSVAYINNNGNITFQNAFGGFTSTGFPNATQRMVAPFWADVDTRPANGGQVWYRVTPTALYVNWVEVGYFSMQTDKKNTFQLIITNGLDPVIGIGNNVSFCYLDMQWTTGSASGGSGGFGGTPATVGANRGNNTGDYIQFGRFGQAGGAYDGPFGNTDGIDWLDDKNFVFTTEVGTQNIPPIATGLYLCDTLRACVGQVSQLEVTFLGPENGQTVVATSSAPTLSNWTEIVNTTGIVATVIGEFTATALDEGFHTVIFQGTDDGSPNLTSTVQIVIEIIPAPSSPPVISGNSAICTGQSVTLTASDGFNTYTWSNGQTGQSITVSQAGSYTVTGAIGLCQLTSDPFTVGIVTPPALSITGPATYCGTPLPTLTASSGYDSYIWSDGQQGETISATGGVYTVTGSYQGCENISAPFTLTEIDPGPPVIFGDAQYCEGGQVTLSTNAVAYTTVVWSTGATTSSITATAGTYTVTGSILNCTYTSAPFTVQEIVLPPVEITGDAFYCENGIAFLSATPGFESYTWNNNAFGPNINVLAGTYFVTASIGPCSTFSLTFTVTEVANPAPVITGPTQSCGGLPVELGTTLPYSTYNWSTGATTASAIVTSGAHTVTVTNAFGCSGTSAPFNVLVANDPTAAYEADPPSPQLPNTNVVFSNASAGNGGTITTWAWEIGAQEYTGAGPHAHSFFSPGTYPVVLIVTTADGCVDTLISSYTIIPAEITVPNVFTPNSDGVNDYFSIQYIEYFRNTVAIYNRWGQLLFEADNYRNTWRATDVPDGTYYYVVRLLDNDQTHTGHVTILR